MKKFKLILPIVLVLTFATSLVGCSKYNSTTQNENQMDEDHLDKEIVLEEPNHNTPDSNEDLDKKSDSMKNLKVVACSKNIVKVLELLEYENVIAIPSDVSSSVYTGAIKIESYDKNGLAEVKSQKPDIYFAESGIDYDIPPNEYSNQAVTFYSFKDLESTKISIELIGESLGLRNKALEISKSLEQNI